MPTIVDPRYPIGKYEAQPFSIERKVEWLADIKFLPLLLENAILNLDEAQLHPYGALQRSSLSPSALHPLLCDLCDLCVSVTSVFSVV